MTTSKEIRVNGKNYQKTGSPSIVKYSSLNLTIQEIFSRLRDIKLKYAKKNKDNCLDYPIA